jgi:N-acetylmuramoyl-L-alanine amidase
MASGKDLIKLANKHVGERYKLGSFAPKDNPNWKGPWDCAEFVSWVAYQTTGLLIGCTDNRAQPSLADAYSGAWARDAAAGNRPLTIGQAMGVAGAVLIRKPGAGRIGHVALSLGDGATVEAHSEARGVINDRVDGRRWDLAMLIPTIVYPDNLTPVIYTPPSGLVLRLTDPPMHGALVKRLQKALKAKGIDPGVIDGVFGPHTVAAVSAFQLQEGLVRDGEVGDATWKRLEGGG